MVSRTQERRGGGESSKNAQNRIIYFNWFLLINLYHLKNKKQTTPHTISPYLICIALLCSFQQFPGWNKNQSMEETAKSPLPRGASRIFTMLSSPHPSPNGQPDSTEAGRCSPSRRPLLSLHLRGPQPTPGWGLASAARPPSSRWQAGLATDHPGPALCLQALLAVPHLNASFLQPGKRDPDTQGSSRQGLDFPAQGPSTRKGLTAPSWAPYLFVFLHTVFITHFLKTMASAPESPLCSSQCPNRCLQLQNFIWNRLEISLVFSISLVWENYSDKFFLKIGLLGPRDCFTFQVWSCDKSQFSLPFHGVASRLQAESFECRFSTLIQIPRKTKSVCDLSGP